MSALALLAVLALLGSRLGGALTIPEDGLLHRCALYVMGGAVVLHLLLTLLDFAGIPWNPFLLAGLAILFFILGRRFLPRAPERTRLPWDPGWGDALALAALGAFVLIGLTGWILFPDFVYHWGIKGHRFFLARGVDYAWLSPGWNWVVHPEYPNLVPELFAVSALAAGRFEAPAMVLGASAFCALLLAEVREGLRRGGADRFTRQAGLALTALAVLGFGIGHSMAAAADWWMALALAAAVPALLRPADRQGDLQIGVAAAFAAASKVEGVTLAAFLALVQLGRRAWTERRLDPGAAARVGLPAAAVVLPWLARLVRHDLFLPLHSGPFQPDRAGAVFAAILEALRTPAWHGFGFAALLPPLLLIPRRTRPFAVAATLQLAFYVYVYFTARVEDPRYFVLSNFARLILHLIPASLAMTLIALSQKKTAGGENPTGRLRDPGAPP
ncbi:MAG TPA: hypothetical protein VF789_00255 [Thermoanaerobaculia bacterium]